MKCILKMIIVVLSVFFFVVLLFNGCGRSYQKEPSSSGLPKFLAPRSSADHVITAEVIKACNRENIQLKHIDSVLVQAMGKCGYSERSYYCVPGGFALATRMERIDENAYPVSEMQRFNIENRPMIDFSFEGLIKALFTANPGYFRTIVFIVTDSVYLEKDTTVTKQEVLAWVKDGGKTLPTQIGQLSFTNSTYVVALVYEFIKNRSNDTAVLTMPSKHQGLIHLKNAGLLAQLGGN
jgi:hypothetical protein